MPAKLPFPGLLALTVLASACIVRIDGDGDLTESVALSQSLPANLADFSLASPAGEVTLRTGDDVGVEAILRWREGDEQPRIVATETGSIVDHEWSCRSRGRCSVDLVVTLPDGMERVSLDLDAGDVSAVGTEGTLIVDLDAGDVTLDEHAGDVDVRIDAGDFEARELDADEAFGAVDAGDIELRFARRPSRVQADTEAGNIDIVVPAGAYALDLSTDVGRVDVGPGITRDGTSDATIEARAAVGSVTVDDS